MFAPEFPLSFSNKGGYKSINSRKKLAKFHLTNLLLTNPGEKISLPTYGVGMRKYLFENLTSQVMTSIQANIRSQVSQYLPYIRLGNVSIIPTEENSIRISLTYSIANTNLTDQLNLDINNSFNTLGLGSNY